jgi:serine/alanine adding enzyme
MGSVGLDATFALMTPASRSTSIRAVGPTVGAAATTVDGHIGSEALEVVRTLDATRWSAYVERHPNGGIFHTPEMFRVFAETKNHRPAVWATIDGGGRIHALMTPVTIATFGTPLRSLTTRAVAFAEPLFDREDALHALLQAYRSGAPGVALFTEIRNLTDNGQVAGALTACGFRHEAHLNFLIDLTLAEDDLWRRVASSARRNVQKARRLGVSIEEAEDAEGIASAYQVLREVYRRIRVPLPDRSLFDAASRILGPLGRFKVLLARFDGRTIGALTLLLYAGVVTYWYTGTLREYGTYRAGDLLVAHAIELGRSLGYRVLDFGGAGRPDEPYGVRDFKAKYGGRLVDFGRDVWTPSPLRLRVSTAGYGLLRRFL